PPITEEKSTPATTSPQLAAPVTAPVTKVPEPAKVSLSASGSPEEVYNLENAKILLSFTNKGAALKQIQMKQFFYEGGKYIDISAQSDTYPLYLQVENANLGADYKLLERSANSLTFLQESKDLAVEKKFILGADAYDLTLQIKVTNKGNANWTSRSMLRWGTSMGPFLEEKKRTRYDEEIMVSYFDVNENSEEKVEEQTITKRVKIDWVGMDNRYFFAAIMPEKTDTYDIYLKNEKTLYDQEIGILQDISLASQASAAQNYTIYIGPKDERLLKEYNRNLEAISERGFSLIVLIGKGIKWLLFQINSVAGNFAISIILMTLLLKILLNPLTNKSMESAKKMQTLQPQITALKAKYANADPKEMNAKIWELYRREKVNPASGCLPMLLQMPFFFALYNVLPYIVELKDTNFLWITDLSSPDTVAYVNLLLTNNLNILPLLLTVFSFIQTKVSQGGHANTGQGKMMEGLMPIIFLFIFWNMPSGLVLYWLMQTVFTILHQLYKNHRPSKKKSSKKKIANKSV
ncbi:MAG: hypothetical protein CVV50_03300, partial [Spirochaetae bacterium HGW-Spirochaetae-6]